MTVDLAMADGDNQPRMPRGTVGDNLARLVLSLRVGERKALSAVLCSPHVSIIVILLSSRHLVHSKTV